MRYTTGWARRDCKNQEQWDDWVSGLQDCDVVLYQEFIPRGRSCLDSQIQCWRFWPAVYRGDVVFYNNDTHPIKNGIAVYWNTDDPHGDVFASRIVPYHRDLVDDNSRFIDCHAPVFEPDWLGKDECYLFIPHQPNPHRLHRAIKNRFPRNYRREVNGGDLLIVFADEDEVKIFVSELEGVQYCYSEYLE